MSTMHFSYSPSYGAASPSFAALAARYKPLAAILAAHALVFFFIYSGLLQRTVQLVAPQALMVSVVASTKAPVPAPAPAKLLKLQTPEIVTPPLPQIAIAPNEHAISLPQPAAAQPEKAVQASPPVAAAAPAPAAARSGPRTLTSSVEYIQPPQVVYPNMSKRLGEQGKVVLRVLVNEKGQADQVLVESSSGSARLDEAGRQAALHALFNPYIEDGRAVAVYVIVPLTFSLSS